MSRKSRERREKHKAPKPDDYFSNGVFEIVRFGNSTSTQHAAYMEYLSEKYPSKYNYIEERLSLLKEKIFLRTY